MNTIATAGNVVVPALLVLEKLGFVVERRGSLCRASRQDEVYVAEDPVAVLGLVKLVEARTWDWKANDTEIDDVLKRYDLA
jgi:hypothetical protein